ncbi:MAG: putative amidohydrolase [Bacteroidia bacterium]|jgi:omega-amidase
MRDLRITICQQPLAWEDKQTNLQFWEEKLRPLKGQTDLIVFPEMFTTGFTMNVLELAESMDGPTITWIRDLSEEIGATITGSVIIEEDGKFYNRMLWANPDGSFTWYDKRHLFSFANEDRFFTAGSERKIIEKDDWKFMPQVCYDLRFPVFSRNLKSDRYDVLIYVANWPAARSSAWRSLLVARAHENQCYVIGVNRVGTDGKGIEYDGSSLVVSPKGDILSSFDKGEEAIETISLSRTDLDNFCAKFRPLDDADEFNVKL